MASHDSATKSGRPESPPTKLEKKLHATLWSLIKAGGSQAALAARSRVSTKTIAAILHDNFAKKSKSGKPAKMQQRVGWAEALTRLAMAHGLDLKETLNSYGLSLDDDAVGAAVERAKRNASRPDLLQDSALSAIRSRTPAGPRVGILAWPPFIDPQDPKPSESIAGRYAARIIGTINPHWAGHIDFVKLSTVTVCMDALASSQPEQAVQAVIGPYPNSYRRSFGLDFVAPIKFLYFALGGLASSKAWTWNSILKTTSTKCPVAIVPEEEVGDLYVSSLCDFAGRVNRTDTADPRHLADCFISAVATDMNALHRRGVILLADQQICLQVKKELVAKGWNHIPNGTAAKQGMLDSGRQASPPENPFYDIDYEEDLTPMYQASVAVRFDDFHWKRLLESAHEEIYRQGWPLLARLYAEMIAVNQTELYWRWEQGCNVPQKLFCEAIFKNMNEQLNDLDATLRLAPVGLTNYWRLLGLIP